MADLRTPPCHSENSGSIPLDDYGRIARIALDSLQRGSIAEAQQLYSELIQISPFDPDVNLYLGAIAVLQSRWSDARVLLETSLQHRLDCPDAWTLLGSSLLQLGLVTDAQSCHLEALRLAPEMPEPHRGLADVYRAMGQLDAAIACYEQALDLRTDFPQASWNLATTRLLAGDYYGGWSLYQTRFSGVVGVAPLLQPSLPQWNGQPLELGQRLLLVAEQGLGDTLQFARYVLFLASTGVEVKLVPQPSLLSLLGDSGLPVVGFDSVVEEVEDGRGLWAPLLSVPGFLGVTPASPLVSHPYLEVDSQRFRDWQCVLRGDDGFTVALHWQGNPSVEVGNLKGRSLPLDVFAPLASCENVRFVSLQKGFGSEQLAYCSFTDHFADCQSMIDQVWDFRDIAAILVNCDLVITSDSGLAHLAGALGLPVWLLLHRIPDWRWGMDGETTFWYPSMRLFRQQVAGDWAELMQRVLAALQDVLALR